VVSEFRGDFMIEKIKKIIKEHCSTKIQIIENGIYQSIVSEIAVLSLEPEVLIISFSAALSPDISATLIQTLMQKINVKILIAKIHMVTKEGDIIFGYDAEKYFYERVRKNIEQNIRRKIAREYSEMNFLIHSRGHDC
jgi:hypothetical protein